MTLREARLAKNLTQVELAEKSGIPQTHISAIELGKVQSPEWTTVAKLAGALEMRPEDVFPVTTERSAS